LKWTAAEAVVEIGRIPEIGDWQMTNQKIIGQKEGES
jgi:hypothetical protein